MKISTFILSLVGLLFSGWVSAQATCGSGCGKVHCMGLVGLTEQHDSFIPAPEGFDPNGARDVIITVNYNGFTPQAQGAFQYAVDIWSSLLTSGVPIVIDATWEDIPGSVLGYASATGFWQNFSGAPQTNMLYPSALADKLAGFNIDPGAPDIEAAFDSGTNWYFGLDGNPGNGQFDFVSVVLHELGHGLGVIGSAGYDAGTGFFYFSNPSIYDTFVENGANASILSFTDGSTALGNQLTSNNLFWNGANAVSNNGGVDPKMYAPATWSGGSSYSHVDENTYAAGNQNSLMTPFIAPGEAIHDPGPIVMGLMADIGWTVAAPAACEENVAYLNLLTDCYGNETSWEIVDDLGNTVDNGGPYAFGTPSLIDIELCLPTGCYTLIMYDSFGDGLAGTLDPTCGVDGDFALTDASGNILAQMGVANFGFGAAFDFCIGDLEPCTNLNATTEDAPCQLDQNGVDLLPVAIIFFDFAGDCIVQELCLYENGVETCFDLPSLGITLGAGDGLNITQLTPNTDYFFTYTTSQGTTSDFFFFTAGNCEDDEIICDCAGTQHTIGVLSWLGDGFLDDGSYEWNGQLVDFNCSTWGFDCGDAGINSDPNGVCSGNLPPNNGCVGEIFGCTAVNACNYNPAATVSDGSCTYDCYGCTNSTACNYSPTATIDDGSCDFSCLGCTVPTACNYNPNATINNGSCDFTCYGCTDATACNYSPTATINNGSCNYSCYGCTDSDACNYSITATIENGTCTYDCYGCTNSGACNYDPTATINDGSCDFTCLGCTDSGACNYNPTSTINDGSCDYSCLGCTNPNACNYNAAATVDDGSCDFTCFGCTDVEACNYSAVATIDNGTCNYDCYGCNDAGACNYDPTSTINDGSCDYSCLGCTDVEACNYDATATIDDGSCDFTCFGCTDVEACNYSAVATIDDGSCDYEICIGCTDESAVNYNPLATTDDGSCIYDCVYPTATWTVVECDDNDGVFYVAMGVTALGNGAPYVISNNLDNNEINLTFSGTINLGPFQNGDQVVIAVNSTPLPGCFFTSPILTCETSVSEIAAAAWTIFPVPADDVLYLQSDFVGLVDIEIVDLTGKLISRTTATNTNSQITIEVNGITAGAYLLNIYADGSKSSHRVLITH